MHDADRLSAKTIPSVRRNSAPVCISRREGDSISARMYGSPAFSFIILLTDMYRMNRNETEDSKIMESTGWQTAFMSMRISPNKPRLTKPAA